MYGLEREAKILSRLAVVFGHHDRKRRFKCTPTGLHHMLGKKAGGETDLIGDYEITDL
jgi:hypothetical protein